LTLNAKKEMISKINSAPSNVAAFRATGEVTKSDYDNVVIPGIDALVAKQDKINFLLVVDTEMKNFTLGALLKDLGVGLKHFTKWHKMAIVSEEGGVIKFTDFFSYIAPGEAKGFTHAELEEAKQWVSS
jgi:hypothetical protein